MSLSCPRIGRLLIIFLTKTTYLSCNVTSPATYLSGKTMYLSGNVTSPATYFSGKTTYLSGNVTTTSPATYLSGKTTYLSVNVTKAIIILFLHKNQLQLNYLGVLQSRSPLRRAVSAKNPEYTPLTWTHFLKKAYLRLFSGLTV